MAASTVLQAALLITPAFHFRASLRKLRSTPYVSFRLYSFQPLAVHRLPMLGSPAGRCGLRLYLFNCLRFALAIKVVVSCSALRAVMFFANSKSKNLTSPSLLHMPAPSVRTSLLPVCHPCSTRRTARARKNKTSAT
jgi:hypothetical protein